MSLEELRTSSGFAKRGILIAIVVVGGLYVASALPCLLNAIDRGKQKQAMEDLRLIGNRIVTLRGAGDSYPTVRNVSELIALLGGDLPVSDPWGNPYTLESTHDTFFVVSYAKGGVPDFTDSAEYEGPTVSFESDIAFRDGRFVQWPEGTQQ